MHYRGGKTRLCKKISAVIESYREPGQLYVEPFVGGGSVFAEVDNPRQGGELNNYKGGKADCLPCAVFVCHGNRPPAEEPCQVHGARFVVKNLPRFSEKPEYL